MKKDRLEDDLLQAQRQVYELSAQLTSRISGAFDELPYAGKDTRMGSGVILTIKAMGGAEIVRPVMLRDGLSNATILTLQDDLRHSFECATMVNPAMARTGK